MKERIRIGIVGAGRIAEAHVHGYRQLADKVEIAGVADVRADLASARAREWGAARSWSSVAELVQDETLDAVDICLPHHLHVDAVEQACAAGKHILIEKPIARSLAEADAIIGAAERAGVTLMVAHNHVFNPVVTKAKEIIDQGLIGDVHLVKAYSLGWFLFTPHDFRKSASQTGGGVFIDTGAHFVYILQTLCGEIVSVSATQARLVRTEAEGEDDAIVSLRFAQGAIGEITTTYAARIPGWELGFPGGWDQTFIILGSKGAVRFSLPDETLWFYSENERFPAGYRGWTECKMPGSYARSFDLEVAHFVDVLRSETRPSVTGAEGRKTLAVIQAAYQSAETGRVVEVAV